MRLSVMVFGVVCFCAVVIGIAAPAIQDDDVRGAFLTSRPKDKQANTGATTARPSRRRPKSTTGSNNPNKPDKTPVKPGPSKPGPSPSDSSTPVNARRLGLGITLFMRDSNGLALRTDPDHVFRKGDRVRVLLETNTDGYLYIFNTTNDGPATMIYPDKDLDEAGNYLQAHVPFEIPTSLAGEERLRWFAFDESAGTEHLYFVFTREPLKDVPNRRRFDRLLSRLQMSGPTKRGSVGSSQEGIAGAIQDRQDTAIRKSRDIERAAGRHARAGTGERRSTALDGDDGFLAARDSGSDA